MLEFKKDGILYNGKSLGLVDCFEKGSHLMPKLTVEKKIEVDGEGNPVLETQDCLVMKTHILPQEDETLSIGAPDKRIKDIYVSEGTIFMGDSEFGGTSIDVKVESATTIEQRPTISASRMVLRQFKYTPSGGDENTEPPQFAFDIPEGTFPITLDVTEGVPQFQFGSSLSSRTTGEIAAKKGTFSNAAVDGVALDVIKGKLKVGSEASLDISGPLTIMNAVVFEGDATLGTGDDDISINCGDNNIFSIISKTLCVGTLKSYYDWYGNLPGSPIVPSYHYVNAEDGADPKNENPDDIYCLYNKGKNLYYIGTATQAEYADLAEIYTIIEMDKNASVGTVIAVNDTTEEGEVRICLRDLDEKAFGVVSEKPGYLMNADSEGVAVTLKGKTPVRVVGEIRKGDKIVSAGDGCAKIINHDSQIPLSFGISLEENLDQGEKSVQCIIL